MKHFLNTQDWSRPELDALLAQAAEFKRSPRGRQLEGRSIALVFFNPRCARAPASRSAPSSWAGTPSCCSRARTPGRSSSTTAR
jgi:aspartate carbamoyltransferase catalytic subunit